MTCSKTVTLSTSSQVQNMEFRYSNGAGKLALVLYSAYYYRNLSMLTPLSTSSTYWKCIVDMGTDKLRNLVTSFATKVVTSYITDYLDASVFTFQITLQDLSGTLILLESINTFPTETPNKSYLSNIVTIKYQIPYVSMGPLSSTTGSATLTKLSNLYSSGNELNGTYYINKKIVKSGLTTYSLSNNITSALSALGNDALGAAFEISSLTSLTTANFGIFLGTPTTAFRVTGYNTLMGISNVFISFAATETDAQVTYLITASF